jgi:hypothetical protein
MDKLCLVFDLDDTILHYVDSLTRASESSEELINEDESEGGENESEGGENELNNIIQPGDKLFFRPGFWKFIEYVKSKEGKIVIGVWTFGKKAYANALRPLLEKNGDVFQFMYTVEDMKKGMLDKQLNYVVNKFDTKMRNNLGIRHHTRSRKPIKLPKNIFLIDNLHTNINHDINRKNGILVESFTGHNDSDTMFDDLNTICESLLSDGKIPSEYIQKFKINGKKIALASIGNKFDGGIRPIDESRSRTQSGGKTKKIRNSMKVMEMMMMMNKNKIKTQRLNKVNI